MNRFDETSVALFFDAYLQDFAYLGHSYVPPGAAELYVKSSDAISCVFTMPPASQSPRHLLKIFTVCVHVWKYFDVGIFLAT